MGSDLRFLRRNGWGLHNRRIGEGSGWRIVSGGSYVLSVLSEVTFGGGSAFGGKLDKCVVETWPCGEETSDDCGDPG